MFLDTNTHTSRYILRHEISHMTSQYIQYMCIQVIHRTTVATNSTHLSSNNACHCKTLWISAGNDLIIHYTFNITQTRQQQQHTTNTKYTFTLPSTKPLHVIVKGKDTIWETNIQRGESNRRKHFRANVRLLIRFQFRQKLQWTKTPNSPVSPFSYPLPSSCLTSCVFRKLLGPHCTCTLSTFHKSLATSFY